MRLAGGAIVGIPAVVAATGVYLLLRVAARSMADLPDHVLDERMRRERDRVDVDAIRLESNVALALRRAAEG